MAWTKDSVKKHLLTLQRRMDAEYKQHHAQIKLADRQAVLQKRSEAGRRTSEFNRKHSSSAGTEIMDEDEVLALFAVYEELFTVLESVTGAPSEHHGTDHTRAGLTALLGRLRVGAPAVGGDALELLMERFQRDAAERITHALRLRYVVDVCNLSDSDIAGLAAMDAHKRILKSIRDEARGTWARTHGEWSARWIT
jgi:hypothetical protein